MPPAHADPGAGAPTGPERLALVGLGSNLGESAVEVRKALTALAGLPATRLLRHSRLFRTAPWGVTAQPAFVNAAAELATRLAPRELLDHLLAIEQRQGRHRHGERWGPRLIDLDLLCLGDLAVDEPGLVLPHPHLAERAFVLAPLADLDPDRMLPGVGRVRELLARVDASGCVPLLEVGQVRGE
ncbi:MAG: 2-amino-4-hydroxy-6-hydroxymethyldihydropteridine diphosphokinase [Xanthomonadales bacterium]|nr:2-amino-4-hydroxy-6-hydroxymethyldihydropteridine diphosphokinase [Xanthomonadales bacterium]